MEGKKETGRQQTSSSPNNSENERNPIGNTQIHKYTKIQDIQIQIHLPGKKETDREATDELEPKQFPNKETFIELGHNEHLLCVVSRLVVF